MQQAWLTICLLFEVLTIQLGNLAEATAFVNGRGSGDLRTYFKGILIALAVIVILPAILIGIGVFWGMGWLVSTVGIVWGIFTLWFSFTVMAPLGLLLTVMSRGTTTRDRNTEEEIGFGHQYVRFILTMLFLELALVLYFSVFRTHSNPVLVPTLVISAILILLASAKWLKRVVTVMAVITVVAITFAFVLPEDYNLLAAKKARRDQQVSFQVFCVKNPLVLECQEQRRQELSSRIEETGSIRFVVSPGIPEERVIPPGVCASVFSPGDVLIEKFFLDTDRTWKPLKSGITLPGEHKSTNAPGMFIKAKISAANNKAENVVIKQWRDPECL